MSVIYVSELGWIISHSGFVNDVYLSVKEVGCAHAAYEINQLYFLIKTPFLKNGQYKHFTNNDFLHLASPRKKIKIDSSVLATDQCTGEVGRIQCNAEKIIHSGQKSGFLDYVCTEQDFESNNLEAREASEAFYRKESKQLTGNFHGGNISEVAVVSVIQGEKYLIPPRCRFFCYDVRDIQKYCHLLNSSFDFILLDPPWWNKYIRRKKSKTRSAEGYQMMYNEDLAQLPISSLAAPGTLVAVWCTNSDSHLAAIKDSLFPAWGVTFIGKWFWLKVTRGGQAVCSYSKPPGKQPFEQIVFGWYEVEGRSSPLPEDGKIIVSVPSALHSHKPPLADVLAKYLPPSPRCMELFARYLVPGYTSWGSEVLKLQQMCLYQQQSS